MLTTVLFTTWALIATVTTLHCTGTDCRPTRATTGGPRLHTMAIFRSAKDCDLFRQKLAQMPRPVAAIPAQPDRTLTEQITYTCQEGEDAR